MDQLELVDSTIGQIIGVGWLGKLESVKLTSLLASMGELGLHISIRAHLVFYVGS
jgi:hypothetical protein